VRDKLSIQVTQTDAKPLASTRSSYILANNFAPLKWSVIHNVVIDEFHGKYEKKMRISQFQKYSQKENTVTNNVLLMLSRLNDLNVSYYKSII